MRYAIWSPPLLIAMVLGTTAVAQAPSVAVRSVRIGQVDWMVENINVGAFRNGDAIPAISDPAAWADAGRSGRPAMAVYDNLPESPVGWGRLYNHAAVTDVRGLCPSGWRVPEDRDWAELEQALGPATAALRLRNNAGWTAGAQGRNDVGFGALPAGFRTQRGDYFLGGRVAYFWSATSVSEQETTAQMLFDYDPKIFRIVYQKAMGMSLRCVRNAGP